MEWVLNCDTAPTLAGLGAQAKVISGKDRKFSESWTYKFQKHYNLQLSTKTQSVKKGAVLPQAGGAKGTEKRKASKDSPDLRDGGQKKRKVKEGVSQDVPVDADGAMKVEDAKHLKPLFPYWTCAKNTVQRLKADVWSATLREKQNKVSFVIESKPTAHGADATVMEAFECREFGGSKQFILNVGSPVLNLAWCPTPSPLDKQFLAVAAGHESTPPFLKQDPRVQTVIQLWDFGNYNAKGIRIANVSPRLALGLLHNGGIVRQVAWCPAVSYLPAENVNGTELIMRSIDFSFLRNDGSIRTAGSEFRRCNHSIQRAPS